MKKTHYNKRQNQEIIMLDLVDILNSYHLISKKKYIKKYHLYNTFITNKSYYNISYTKFKLLIEKNLLKYKNKSKKYKYIKISKRKLYKLMYKYSYKMQFSKYLVIKDTNE